MVQIEAIGVEIPSRREREQESDVPAELNVYKQVQGVFDLKTPLRLESSS